MSGVYIRGMEMPKDCGHCPLNKLNTEYGGLVYECIITGHYLDDGYEGTIMSNCPLIPVPDHGRLADADKLRHSHCAECTLYPDNCLGDECDWDSIFHIDHAPTIIPADHEEGAGE